MYTKCSLFYRRSVDTGRSQIRQFKKRMDIFCSTSVRSRAVQNSWNEIIWSPSRSASTIVLSAMLTSCSSLIKTIFCWSKSFDWKVFLRFTWCCRQPSFEERQATHLSKSVHHCPCRTFWKRTSVCLPLNSACFLYPFSLVESGPTLSWIAWSSAGLLNQNRNQSHRRKHWQFCLLKDKGIKNNRETSAIAKQRCGSHQADWLLTQGFGGSPPCTGNPGLLCRGWWICCRDVQFGSEWTQSLAGLQQSHLPSTWVTNGSPYCAYLSRPRWKRVQVQKRLSKSILTKSNTLLYSD